MGDLPRAKLEVAYLQGSYNVLDHTFGVDQSRGTITSTWQRIFRSAM
jgi:hypothetical protein